MKKYKLFIFDLDGVIFDTKSNMRASWNFVKKKYNLNIKFNDYFSLIGVPFNKILKRLKIIKNKNYIAQSYSLKSKEKISLVKIYPGVRQVLKEIKKSGKVAVVTSKDKRRTEIFLNKFNLSFDAVCCPQKGLKGKPDPDQILKILKKFSIKKKDCVYVGDMLIDSLAAKNAKIDFIITNYGYYPQNFKKYNKYQKINKFKDLLKYKI